MSSQPFQPHICFVTDELYPATKGGIGRIIYGLVGQLHALGWQVTLLFAAPETTADQMRAHAADHWPAVQIVAVAEVLARLPADEQPPQLTDQQYQRSLHVALALRQLCREVAFSCVEFTDYLGMGYVSFKWKHLLGGELAAIPLWVRLYGSYEICAIADDRNSFSLEQQRIYEMERYCLRHADGWLSLTTGIIGVYHEFYGDSGCPVLVDPPAFERMGLGNQHPRTLAPPYRVLFYGKLQPLKGADLFVQAAVELCATTDLSVSFDLVGHEVLFSWSAASYHAELEQLIPARYRERFRFHGRIEPSQLEQLALACTVAVIPSRTETFCLAAHELNWIGIPLVLSDLPAFRSYFVDGRDCRFFDLTSAGLACVLAEVLQQPDGFTAWQWNAPQVLASNATPAVYAAMSQTVATPPTVPAGILPLVSLLVADTAADLDRLLQPVRAGGYPAWELLIATDDGQAMGSDAQVRRLGERYHSRAAAWNAAAQAARGAFVLPLRGDEVLEVGFVAQAVEAFARQPEVVAVSGWVRDAGTVAWAPPHEFTPDTIAVRHEAERLPGIFRRELFVQHQFDQNLPGYEQWDFWWRLLSVGGVLATLPAAMCQLHHQTQLSGVTSQERHAYLAGRLALGHTAQLQQHALANFRLQAQVMGAHDQLRQQADALVNERSVLEAESQRLAGAWEQQRAQLLEQAERIAALEHERDGLWAESQHLAGAWEQQRTQLAEQAERIAALEHERDGLWAESQHLAGAWEQQRTQLAEQAERIAALEHERDGLWAEAQRLAGAWEEQRARITALEQTRDQVWAEAQRLAGVGEEQRALIAAQQQTQAAHEQRMSELERERDALRAERDALLANKLVRIGRRVRLIKSADQ